MRTKSDKEKYGRLVKAYAAEVVDFTARLLPDRMEAEEVAQDAFVRAFSRLDSFRGDATFLTWVQRIAYHEAIDRLRRRQPTMADISEVPLAAEDDADLSTEREERIRRLEASIDELPPDDQLLLHLYYYEDRPLRDIAYIMDTEPNTLSARLYRIRKRLLHMIKEKTDE